MARLRRFKCVPDLLAFQSDSIGLKGGGCTQWTCIGVFADIDDEPPPADQCSPPTVSIARHGHRHAKPEADPSS